MKRVSCLLLLVAMVTAVVAFMDSRVGGADEGAVPIYGIKLPPGYRDWTLISVSVVGGGQNDMRAKLGNDIATKAFREGKLPFPDGAIIARLAWNEVTSDENNNAIGPLLTAKLDTTTVRRLLTESYVAGTAKNVQFMVKDSKKYASTGGWGFAQFSDGRPASEAVHKTCFGCHAPAKDRDFVLTRYAP